MTPTEALARALEFFEQRDTLSASFWAYNTTTREEIATGLRALASSPYVNCLPEEAKAWLAKEVPHRDHEDCWYSCATICCDENRRSEKCDCGADEENAMRRRISECFISNDSSTQHN